ncbi:MAG: ribosome assembly RNA-binding protein YhbY [Clostridia bacterium]|nr:ribosome assembly RNA-binding protein YhbY [Clostridia bacterium]
MMTSKQRAKLRGMANTLSPIFQIGKEGISENFIKQISDALEARELIKITVLETSGDTAKEFCKCFAEKVGAEPVQVIGNKIVLYKKSKNNPKIEL